MTFARNAHGGITVVFALIMPVLIGLCALVVDLANLRLNLIQLQQAADAGALAAVTKLSDLTTARKAALTLTQLNAPPGSTNITTNDDIEFGVVDPISKVFSVSTGTPTAVRVTSSRDQIHGNMVETFFVRVVGLAAPTTLRAVSVAVTGSPASCLYVMDPSANGAVYFGAGSKVDSKCGLYIDSNSSTAINTFGVFSVRTAETCVVGSYDAGSVIGTLSPKPKTRCARKSDPLANLPEPAPVSVCSNVNVKKYSGGTLNPGCYTGTTTFAGTIRLNPGLYQFQNGQVTVIAGAKIIGDGVTMYFDKSSYLSLSVHSALDLTAPTTGTYKGMALFLRRDPSYSVLDIMDGASVSLNGTAYAPATTVTLSGASSTTVKNGNFIVKRFSVLGSAAATFDPPLPDASQPAAAAARATLSR